MLVIKRLVVPIDFHSIYFPTIEVNGDQQLFGSLKFFKISSFVFNIRKKLIQVWKDTRVNYDNFNFWVNYPFKDLLVKHVLSLSSVRWNGMKYVSVHQQLYWRFWMPGRMEFYQWRLFR